MRDLLLCWMLGVGRLITTYFLLQDSWMVMILRFLASSSNTLCGFIHLLFCLSRLIRYKPLHPSSCYPSNAHKTACLKRLMDGGLSKTSTRPLPKQNPSVPYLYISLKHPVSFVHWMKLLIMQKLEAA